MRVKQKLDSNRFPEASTLRHFSRYIRRRNSHSHEAKRTYYIQHRKNLKSRARLLGSPIRTQRKKVKRCVTVTYITLPLFTRTLNWDFSATRVNELHPASLRFVHNYANFDTEQSIFSSDIFHRKRQKIFVTPDTGGRGNEKICIQFVARLDVTFERVVYLHARKRVFSFFAATVIAHSAEIPTHAISSIDEEIHLKRRFEKKKNDVKS